jgi:hypothetical protein
MRILTASICSTALFLAVAQAVETRITPASSPAPLAVDATEQETVNLAVSGMT